MSKQFKIVFVAIFLITIAIFVFIFTNNQEKKTEISKVDYEKMSNEELANLALNPDNKDKTTTIKKNEQDKIVEVEKNDSKKDEVDLKDVKIWNKNVTQKIITIFTDFSLIDMEPDQLVEILKKEGVEVVKERVGNSRTGERFEIKGKLESAGLDDFYASFDIMEDEKALFARAYSTFSPHEASYNDSLEIIREKALNQTQKKLSANLDLGASQRWEYDDEWSLWIFKGENRNIDESEKQKEIVRFGFELIME